MKLISNTLRKRINHILYLVRLRCNISLYNSRKPRLLKKIREKERIKVLFFPINLGMWKNDYLFSLLMKDPLFDPYVVSFFVPGDNQDYQRRNQDEMKAYFTSKGFPYFDMYDFEKGEWFDIEKFSPDVVFYAQAVYFGYKRYSIKSIWKNSVFYYIPYCILMENETRSDNTLLFNICNKVFAPSEFHKESWSNFINKGRNVVVTGYPSFDYLTKPESQNCQKWKCNDGRKRIIWAPHHSITNNDILSYSNFLEIADQMLSLAEEYKNDVEFVFKPHPRLRPKLEQMEGWGVKRTNDYYQKWAQMPNTSFVDGDYFDLFLTSDAMIHDCSTFMAEYLLTGKPVMFNLRDESALNLNEYALKCYKHHYIGLSFQDICHFLDEVVLKDNDYMKESRLLFVEKELVHDSKELVAERIFHELKDDFC